MFGACRFEPFCFEPLRRCLPGLCCTDSDAAAETSVVALRFGQRGFVLLRWVVLPCLTVACMASVACGVQQPSGIDESMDRILDECLLSPLSAGGGNCNDEADLTIGDNVCLCVSVLVSCK